MRRSGMRRVAALLATVVGTGVWPGAAPGES